jgi:CheY-like chemotaxis protein
LSYTVLLVDDNQELLDLLSQALSKLGGYTTICASDGLSGLEQAVTIHPDCVIIDVLMPQLDGYQLVRALRGDPETANIPLIILSALGRDKERFAGLAAGVDQYLTKPVSIPTLVAAIQNSMDLSDADRTKQLQELANKSKGTDI